ncbi:M28 family peptidase [bacterium]|nr:M28 family peptidase [bacterium]
MIKNLYEKSLYYLDVLCNRIGERSVGSAGNRLATTFLEKEFSDLGWRTSNAEFEAIDWHDGGASLECNGKSFEVFTGPYSLPFRGSAELLAASTIGELECAGMEGKIILLHGEIAREQLMPKNFVFYNPEEHQKIIALLEKGKPAAVIGATGRNSSLAGGVYPFPLIEDGDFDIPSVYMTEEEGLRLLPLAGNNVTINSVSERIPGKGYNIIAVNGPEDADRIVVTAHIDAKKGTPGAIDNATGVVTLLLLAELLRDYDGPRQVELVAFNGEDYYAVPGQMNYIAANQDRFNTILLDINIDGAGYQEGMSAFSEFGLPDDLSVRMKRVISQYPGITTGPQWPQGDHSIFVQFGVPAIAVTSKWFIENMEHQDVTHTPKDRPEITDCRKIVEIAHALNDFIRMI